MLMELRTGSSPQTSCRSLPSGSRIRRPLGKFFSRLRPEAKFDIAEREWSVTLGVHTDDEGTEGIQYLVDALDGLEKLALAQPTSNLLAW
jgi:hypothetical protein